MAGEMRWYPGGRGKEPDPGSVSHRTRQPDWEFIAQLGDRNPLDYGGYFIYRDRTGVYPEEGEMLLLDDYGDEETGYTAYRILLDRLKLVDGWLVPFGYDLSWPHPVDKYDEWFHRDLDAVARSMGADISELEQAFTSADPLDRARAYESVGLYHGWENFDSYPLTLTRGEAEERYRTELGRS